MKYYSSLYTNTMLIKCQQQVRRKYGLQTAQTQTQTNTDKRKRKNGKQNKNLGIYPATIFPLPISWSVFDQFQVLLIKCLKQLTAQLCTALHGETDVYRPPPLRELLLRSRPCGGCHAEIQTQRHKAHTKAARYTLF